MSKYINVDKIEYKTICYPHLDFATGTIRTEQLAGFYALKTDIDAMPTADVQEVKRGHWDEIRDEHGNLVTWIHRECGRMSMGEDNYCPKCGALMLEDKDVEIS